ncbi:MAG TPA: FAD-dependent oxidoreductase [Rhizomicrobium sp.]|nr:FAD-dependent oxidoreductase [Rhizomicrobium sp.]
MARVAVIGTGISGLSAAYLLHPFHDITVYEKERRVGGHTRTVTVRYDGRDIPVDTGFIVFNRPNYPHFSAMLRHLGVPVHESNMTFAASIQDGWFEWGAENLNTVFGQRRNFLRPAFYGVCRDVMHFNAKAIETVERHPGLTLEGLIRKLGLGDWFRRYYILPMGGAIWSCPLSEMLEFPARTFVRFFQNHGLLAFNGQPQWYTVTGGAQNYINRLTQAFARRIRTGLGVRTVLRTGGGIEVIDQKGSRESFDHVVFACHGNEALAALGDADEMERRTLGAFRYQKNDMVLHKDASVMPRRKRCWAAWNYRSEGEAEDAAVSVSYWMNRLQGIDRAYPIFVTLNPSRSIAPEHVFDRHVFDHPVFDAAAIAAQNRLQAMQGVRNTWFCGAHLRHGFHEDGLWSAVNVALRLGAKIPWNTASEAVRRDAAAALGAWHPAGPENLAESPAS